MLVCAECKGVFHPSCTRLECIDNFKKLSTRKRAGWKCDACATETDSVVSQDGRMESELSLASLMEAFQSMEKELGAKITGVKTSVDSVQEQKSELAALKQENHEMREEMADLHQRVREIEQYSRKDNVEIVGVPLTRGEDIYSVLERLAKVLNIQFDSRHVSVVHRRPLRILYESWSSTPLFINEHLTPHYKAVLGRARRLVKEKRLAFAWTRDCRVYVKKTSQHDSPATQLGSLDDLETLVKC
ncbi:hypothetical protein J6590_068169 [Homalodisca vitripennis]|nr:hypothetical protein J6590_068169 [Homalodisca vitripennis]